MEEDSKGSELSNVIRIDDEQEAAILLAARTVEPGEEALAVQHARHVVAAGLFRQAAMGVGERRIAGERTCHVAEHG